MSPIGQNIVIPKTKFVLKKNQIMIGNIVDNTIPSIINHNLPYTTIVNIIFIIEEFNNILTKMIMIGTKGGAHGMIHSVIPTPEKHAAPIIPLENYYYSRNKPPNDSYLIFLITGTRRMKN